VLDYGCGRGNDTRLLQEQGISCTGWDPEYFADEPRAPADVVNLGYVVNVIESVTERLEALNEAWGLTRQVLIVAVRIQFEMLGADLIPFQDGHLSSRGTFQKFFTQSELRELLDTTLGVKSVPAGPGIFFVFREEQDRQSFLVLQYRRRAAAPRAPSYENLFESHRELFAPVLEFAVARGRLPVADEVPGMTSLAEAIGSRQRVLSVVKRVVGPEEWSRIRNDRIEDLLVYLGLARFERRPRLGQLSPGVRRDVLTLFSTYRMACQESDSLLFAAGDRRLIDQACRNSGVGKLTPTALYVHVSALEQLAAVLRIYEGCARSYIGRVEGANIVKLHRFKPKVSYLQYPRFERDPHPTLAGSMVVPLDTFRVRYYDYADRVDPPILHRKEEFVSSEHPMSSKFKRLTRREEALGLFEQPSLIGTRKVWQALLTARGLRLRGHRVVVQAANDTRAQG
jgi:DNA phosphorothioation-associated putative methyltransferase